MSDRFWLTDKQLRRLEPHFRARTAFQGAMTSAAERHLLRGLQRLSLTRCAKGLLASQDPPTIGSFAGAEWACSTRCLAYSRPRAPGPSS